MDIVVLSDIHGDYCVLSKCIECALAKNIKTFIFLGDYDVEKVIAELYESILIERAPYRCRVTENLLRKVDISHGTV